MIKAGSSYFDGEKSQETKKTYDCTKLPTKDQKQHTTQSHCHKLFVSNENCEINNHFNCFFQKTTFYNGKYHCSRQQPK